MSDWKWDGRYPVRARIIDAAGQPLPIPIEGVVCATPDASKPHIGREGLAEEVEGGSPWGMDIRITLDDGGVIFGYECWWEPIGPAGEAPR